MTSFKRVWIAEVPKSCEICGAKIRATFYDAATKSGPWAIMCRGCFEAVGEGRLGIGYGQKYVKKGDDWVKEK